MSKVQFLVALLLVATLCMVDAAEQAPPPHRAPAPGPAPVSPLGPQCPPCPFPFRVVKPLLVSCENGIDASIWVRYEGLMEAGGFQLPRKGEVLSLTQPIRVTKLQPFCVDFHIKQGSKRPLVTATVTLQLAKKIAKLTGEKSWCGEPLYCIELRLLIRSLRRGKFYEVYSGETLIVQKEY